MAISIKNHVLGATEGNRNTIGLESRERIFQTLPEGMLLFRVVVLPWGALLFVLFACLHLSLIKLGQIFCRTFG